MTVHWIHGLDWIPTKTSCKILLRQWGKFEFGLGIYDSKVLFLTLLVVKITVWPCRVIFFVTYWNRDEMLYL